MKSCEEYEALISAFLDGELSEAERSELSEHLPACPACQRYFDDLVAIHDALEQEEVPVPEGFAEAVMARVGETPQEKAKSKVIRFPRWRRWAALAACCAIAAAGLWSARTGGVKTASRMAADSAPERKQSAAQEEGQLPEEASYALTALSDDEAEACNEEPEAPAAYSQANLYEADSAEPEEAKRAADGTADEALILDSAPPEAAVSGAAAPVPPAEAAGKQEALSGTITAGGPAARAWVRDVLGLEWEDGRTYSLTGEEFAGLLDALAAAGEDFRQEPGTGWHLLAGESGA